VIDKMMGRWPLPPIVVWFLRQLQVWV